MKDPYEFSLNLNEPSIRERVEPEAGNFTASVSSNYMYTFQKIKTCGSNSSLGHHS